MIFNGQLRVSEDKFILLIDFKIKCLYDIELKVNEIESLEALYDGTGTGADTKTFKTRKYLMDFWRSKLNELIFEVMSK